MGEWAGLRLLCTLHSSWHLGSLNDCICMRMKRPLTRKLPHSHLGGFDLACTLQILWYVNTALRDSDTGTRAYISGVPEARTGTYFWENVIVFRFFLQGSQRLRFSYSFIFPLARTQLPCTPMAWPWPWVGASPHNFTPFPAASEVSQIKSVARRTSGHALGREWQQLSPHFSLPSRPWTRGREEEEPLQGTKC